MYQSQTSGYVATISAIIITGIVLAVAVAFSSGNFLGRFDSQNVETKDLSWYIAHSCLEYARARLSRGSYSGNEIVPVGTYQCSILSLTQNATSTIIRSTATVNGKSSNLRLTVNNSTLRTIQLEEVTSSGGL